MNPLKIEEVQQYVEQNIGVFHSKRIAGLTGLKLGKVLAKKNPYLFKAKYLLTAQDIIKSLTDAFISSQEETIFGDWLEGLAIFINEKVYDGRKSGIPGIDLEFDKDGFRHIVTIKSGPSWGNSSQKAKMVSDFRTAQKTLRTSNSNIMVRAVNGCCYGKDRNPDKGDYFKLCGQQFWKFISDESELYVNMIEPLGHRAREKNDEFMESYAKRINLFTREFADKFCMSDGSIDWNKFVRLNSGS
ncbi:MAG TPA: PmeII family type II restriction endonuclease [Puia sp.]|nr:PmeII family type II restriction endonuclease [Puia sp.]